MHEATERRSFGEKMGDWFRHVLSCCDEEEEDRRPALQISGPTNFRREDISIPGLDPEQQRFIREKAISDAQKLYAHLQPLRSSPSTHFADPSNKTDTLLPSYEDFTTPRPRPVVSATTPTSPPASRESTRFVDSLKRHSRKLSNSLGHMKPLELNFGGAHSQHQVGREDSKYEMRALMEPSRDESGGLAKMSGESWSGSEQGDKDSGKGLVRI